MKSGRGKIDSEVRYALNDPENSMEMMKKMLVDIENHKKKVSQMKEDVKSLTFANWNNKLLRRRSQRSRGLEVLKGVGSADNIPICYLAVLAFGIILFVFSLFREAVRDSSFKVL